MGLFSMLFGCKRKPVQENNGTTASTAADIISTDDGGAVAGTEGEDGAAALPEGVELSDIEELLLHRSGMSMEPYYMIKSDGKGGYYLKITNVDPEELPSRSGGEESAAGDIYKYVSEVMDCEYGSSIHLTEAEQVNKVRDALYAYGAVEWDGYNRNASLGAGVLDGDGGFRISFRLADGSSVKASGYNCKPKNFDSVYSAIVDLLNETADYSRYVEKDFHASPVTRMFVEFKNSQAGRQWFKLELNNSWKRWSILVRDPFGEVVARDFEISDYGDVQDASELPYERFIAILEKYKVTEWESSDSNEFSAPYFMISISFDNGKSFETGGTLLPENYNEFRQEFTEEIISYYKTIRP